MKTISSDLQALLATDHFVMADLYTFTLADGTIFRLTSFDVDVVWGGNAFSSSGPLIQRSKCSWKAGIEVDTLSITLFPTANDSLEGTSWLSAIRQGALDGALITLERAFKPSTLEPVTGTVLLFPGRIGGIDADRAKADITVNSPMELLNIQLPKNLYSPTCVLNLYDPACGANAGAFSFTGITGSADLGSVAVAGANSTPGYYDQGMLTLAGGSIRRTIKSWSGDVASVLVPFFTIPAPGTTVTLIPGCDHQQATCSGKFDNLGNFEGCPYIPNPTTAI